MFMEYHAYAVWDFMSLLKSLQKSCTCTDVPWIPVGDPETRRFVNEIVLAEESDIDATGKPGSHYELYLDAMVEAGCEVEALHSEVSRFVEQGSFSSNVPQPVQDFVNFSMEVAKQGKAHVVAGVFTFGREDLIPDLFAGVIREIMNQGNPSLSKFAYYLQRHIELDGDEHGPLAIKLVSSLCRTDKQWVEMTSNSLKALEVRLSLWDFIYQQILERKGEVVELV